MIRLGLVMATFAEDLVGEMAERARAAARERQATVVAEREVPGAYDTPLAADRLARRGDIDAVAVIGAVIAGETDHDQIVAQSAADGLRDVSLDRDTPVTLGVAGPGMSMTQANERLDYGARAVHAAVDIIQGS